MSFAFHAVYNVRFGFGALDCLCDELKTFDAKRVLFVTDAGLKKCGVSERVTSALEAKGVSFDEYSDVMPNPADADVEKRWEEFKNNDIDVIIALGGGSAIDTGKACAVLATNGGHLKEYHGRNKIRKATLPLIAIPTTAGTGSEVSMNASIVDAQNHFKLSLRSHFLQPTLAILDPSLLASLPARVAAESSMDAISHASEGFVARRANTYTDAYAVEALSLLFKYIRPFVGSPSNAEAAQNMAIGAMLAGSVFTNAGTGASHALSRSIGGSHNIAHGLGCALFTPYVCKYNFIARTEKYRKMLELMGVKTCAMSDPQVCDRLFAELIRLLEDLGLPTRLSQIGIEREAIPSIAATAAGNDPEAPNPRLTPKESMIQLLEEAY